MPTDLFLKTNVAILLSLLISLSSPAEPNGSVNKVPLHNKDAAKDTQAILKDRKKVKEIAAQNPQAKAVDDMVTTLTGSEESTKELYGISADILPVLMEMNQDNPEKALESLSSYAKNPAEFLSKLPPDIRLKIENLGKKIEATKTKKKP